MNIKNPYKLINKANSSFNLYLEDHDKIENYMVSSKEEIEKTKNLIYNNMSEFKEYTSRLEDLNLKFLDLIEYLIQSDQNNKKLIKSLNEKLNENSLNDKLYYENLSNNLDKSRNDLIKLTADNFKLLNYSIDQSNSNINDSIHKISKLHGDLLVSESEKQLGAIVDLRDGVSSLHDEVSSFRDESKVIGKGHDDLLVSESEKQLNNINDLNNNINVLHYFIESINNNQDEFRKVIDSQIDVSKNLKLAVDLYINNYDDCKKYFFNNKEKVLKNYLDTDELFRLCYFNNIQFLSFSPSENKILLKTKENIKLATNNRFFTIKEVICYDGYSVPQLYQFNDFVVFDIGMNRAYASLRFANFENCSKVFGFEIDGDTYEKALYNINLNPHLHKKIVPFNFGLSNEDAEVSLYYLVGSDGVSTVESDFIDIQYELKRNKDRIQSKLVNVRKTSDVIYDILENENISSNIVLKIDTEGSEYKIIDDIIESGLINKIDLILGEGHRFNDYDIGENLLEFGFKMIESVDRNITYNFAYVKEEYYDSWPLRQ